jgi:hypothetical protein
MLASRTDGILAPARLCRLWPRATPGIVIDTDSEADWARKDDNFGAETPNQGRPAPGTPARPFALVATA